MRCALQSACDLTNPQRTPLRVRKRHLGFNIRCGAWRASYSPHVSRCSRQLTLHRPDDAADEMTDGHPPGGVEMQVRRR
jgi:hypothetical protein